MDISIIHMTILHLGSMWLCINNDNQLIKKWINVVKTNLYLNENIKYCYMHLEMNWIQMHWLELELNCI